MTTVINLLAGPGAGKSLMAADLYVRMKKEHMNVELVREVAKEWALSGTKIGPFEQIAILGEQIQKESSLFGKVDYIITDSPVLLGAFYFNFNHGQEFMNKMVQDYYSFGKKHHVRFLNYMIPRYEEYDNTGRFESEQDAKDLDYALGIYMEKNEYEIVQFDPISKKVTYDKVVNSILKDLK